MKKWILITITGIIIVGIAYFGIELYGLEKGASQKQIGINGTEYSQYQNAELSSFYQDFEKKITNITWTDEPPAKLSGVIFRISESKYFDIELDSIPKLYKMNINRSWNMNEVGNSKIRNIKLVEKK